jgi:hypothetical protein
MQKTRIVTRKSPSANKSISDALTLLKSKLVALAEELAKTAAKQPKTKSIAQYYKEICESTSPRAAKQVKERIQYVVKLENIINRNIPDKEKVKAVKEEIGLIAHLEHLPGLPEKTIPALKNQIETLKKIFEQIGVAEVINTLNETEEANPCIEATLEILQNKLISPEFTLTIPAQDPNEIPYKRALKIINAYLYSMANEELNKQGKKFTEAAADELRGDEKFLGTYLNSDKIIEWGISNGYIWHWKKGYEIYNSPNVKTDSGTSIFDHKLAEHYIAEVIKDCF